MRDGRTRLAHRAGHAVNLETGAVVGVTVQDADAGDTTTMVETLITAAEQVEAVLPDGAAVTGHDLAGDADEPPGVQLVVSDEAYGNTPGAALAADRRSPRWRFPTARTGDCPRVVPHRPAA